MKRDALLEISRRLNAADEVLASAVAILLEAAPTSTDQARADAKYWGRELEEVKDYLRDLERELHREAYTPAPAGPSVPAGFPLADPTRCRVTYACARCGRSPVEDSEGVASCDDCGKKYAVCVACGGHKAAARSLKSHRGLHHPRNASAPGGAR